MLSAREVLDGFIDGSHNELDTDSLNQNLCHVLELAVKCFDNKDTEAAADQGKESCIARWSPLDGCWPATAWNTSTFPQPCPEAIDPDSATKSLANDAGCSVELHCNATTGDWNPYVSNSLLSGLRANDETRIPYANSTDFGQSDVYPTEVYNDYGGSGDSEQFDEEAYTILGQFVTVGHALSLASLIIALTLFSLAKRLHCTRTYIHMNLMTAFMLRSLIWILHTVAFEVSNSAEQQVDNKALELAKRVFTTYNSTALPQLIEWREKWCTSIDLTESYVWCRIYHVFVNYFVTANYFWLLVEGIYLVLLLRTMNASRNHNKYMRIFLVLGWVVPSFSVISYVLVKLLDPSENSSCWFAEKKSGYWWIIKGPILFTVLLNFIIFILVIKVVGSKLKTSHRHRADETRNDYKWRLAKSTGALIPLLGIQYLTTVFIAYIDEEENPRVVFIDKALEILFTSIQGLLVAVIYCFLNGEVQDECKRYWRAWKTEWELQMGNRKRRKQATSHTSLSTLYPPYNTRKCSGISSTSVRQSTTLTTMGRSSIGCEHSPDRPRHYNPLPEIAERSPPSNGKIPHNHSSNSINSRDESTFEGQQSISNGSDRLAENMSGSTFNSSQSEPQGFIETDVVLLKEGNGGVDLQRQQPDEQYPMPLETDLFLSDKDTNFTEVVLKESIL